MLIRFKCSHCGHSVKIDAIHAGKQAKCPGCNEMITIPNAEQVEAAAKGIAAGATAATGSTAIPRQPTPSAAAIDENPYKSPQAIDESDSPDYMSAGPNGPIRYAGFWLRFCAAVVDGIFTNIIQFAMGFGIGFIAVLLGDDSNTVAIPLLPRSPESHSNGSTSH